MLVPGCLCLLSHLPLPRMLAVGDVWAPHPSGRTVVAHRCMPVPHPCMARRHRCMARRRLCMGRARRCMDHRRLCMGRVEELHTTADRHHYMMEAVIEAHQVVRVPGIPPALIRLPGMYNRHNSNNICWVCRICWRNLLLVREVLLFSTKESGKNEN